MDAAGFEIELVPSPGSDAQAAEQQTVDLAQELRSIRGVELDRARSAAPPDTKALDVAMIGELVGAVSPIAGAVATLVGALRGWVTRGDGRKVRVKIGDNEVELTGASREEEQRLVELFAQSVQRG